MTFICMRLTRLIESENLPYLSLALNPFDPEISSDDTQICGSVKVEILSLDHLLPHYFCMINF